jgi:hypothetical protein
VKKFLETQYLQWANIGVGGETAALEGDLHQALC